MKNKNHLYMTYQKLFKFVW